MKVHREQVRRAILKFFEEYPGQKLDSTTIDRITGETGISRNSIWQSAAKMAEAGILDHPRYGTYTMPVVSSEQNNASSPVRRRMLKITIEIDPGEEGTAARFVRELLSEFRSPT